MVKCVDCGFLSARNIKTRELEEVERLFREVGSPIWIGTKEDTRGVPVHERMPLCFMRTYQRWNKFKNIPLIGGLILLKYNRLFRESVSVTILLNGNKVLHQRSTGR